MKRRDRVDRQIVATPEFDCLDELWFYKVRWTWRSPLDSSKSLKRLLLKAELDKSLKREI